jgi:serine/threonine protein kinase
MFQIRFLRIFHIRWKKMSLEGLQLGQYRLQRLIGSGGMGEVYLAEDARINQQVAIKLSRTESTPYSEAESAKETARLFQREAKAIAQLDHPRILPLFSYGEEDVNGAILTYIVMPFRKEGSLTTWLRQRKNKERLSLQAVAHIVNQAADALQYAHNRYIVHQDVKPSNFLIRSSDETDFTAPDLLLTDFGIAKLGTATSSVSHTIRGTATYMAPEQWSGNAVPATDQYALAVMAYELLTGRPPFQGRPEQMMFLHFSVQPEPPSLYNQLLSKDVDSVILKALSKRPGDRFPSISAFAYALQQALQNADAPTFIKTPDNGDLPTLLAISSASEQTVPTSNPPFLATPTSLPNFNGVQNSTTHGGSYFSRIILLLGLVLILIASGLGFYYFQQGNRANTNNIGTTATTQGNNATAITTISTTQVLTITTVIAAYSNPYPPKSGTLVLNDPLSDNTKGNSWNDLVADGYACEFEGGAYHIMQTKNKYYTDCFTKRSFGNFTFEVQMKIINGDCGGEVFRSDTVEKQFYFFRICQDGAYDLNYYVDGTNSTSRTLTGGFSPFIHTGLNQINVVAIVANDKKIDLYVNQQFIESVNDSTYSYGKIAVAASQVSNPTEVVFNNAKVWML